MRSWLAFTLVLAAPAYAQVQPMSGPSDPRIQSIDYVAERVVRLEAAPGYQLMVQLGSDEHIENISVGDSGAWQVSANREGNRLFVKLVQPGAATNMIVVTDARLYSFDLTPLNEPQANMAYAIEFKYPSPTNAATDPLTPGTKLGEYKLSGDQALQPVGMHDDGTHTYIEWAPDQSLPAVYAIDGRGKEALVNGTMRDGLMVIDSVQRKVVFRIDSRRAVASRLKKASQ